MHKTTLSLTAVLMALAACTASPTATNANGDLVKLPEEVAALAAPHQDLTAVRLNPEDNCFWYRHVGPVENTYLPLRTKSGQPICAAPKA